VGAPAAAAVVEPVAAVVAVVPVVPVAVWPAPVAREWRSGHFFS